MSEQVQKQKQKFNPTSPIDLQVMTTEPFISSDYMPDRIREKFRDYVYLMYNDGDIVLDEKGYKITKTSKDFVLDVEGNRVIQLKRDYWATIELFTQDWRLSNVGKRELSYLRSHLNIATDILTVLPECFNRCAFISLERAVCVAETSQGYKGKLRELFNTFFHKQSVKEEPIPAKRNMLGLGKKNSGV